MKRRLMVVAAVTAALAGLAGPAFASDAVTTANRSETNGCVVVIPLHVALCIPRL